MNFKYKKYGSGVYRPVVPITLSFRNKNLSYEITVSVGNYKYETLVGFLPNIADLGYSVVGQQGFFDNFTVKFDYKNEDIELTLKH